jgi:hypothetical protein
MRARGEKDVAEADKFAGMIRSSTRIIFELTAQANMMKGMTLNEPFNELPTSIATFYEKKIEVHRQFIEMASALISGPTPGVDYGAIPRPIRGNSARFCDADRRQARQGRSHEPT